MSIEDLSSLEGSEGIKGSAEISEKYKESVKKSSAGIKKTQKDEKKAKRYDFLLAKFLVELILKKKYDALLTDLFSALDAGYGTNFLLGILSLIYMPISHEIRKNCKLPQVVFLYTPQDDICEFHPDSIPKEIRVRINEWIEDMHNVLRLESSSIISERTLRLIIYDTHIRDFTKHVLMFFFEEMHFKLSNSQAESYGDFILKELEKTLKALLPELRKDFLDAGFEL